MIESLKILPCGKAPKGGDDYYYRELYNISSKPIEFKFKDGLNLIIGPNGCGKSTLMNILKTRMSIFQKNASQTISDKYGFIVFDDEKKKILSKKYEDILSDSTVGHGYKLPTEIKYKNVLTYFMDKDSFNAFDAVGAKVAGVRGKSSDFNENSFFSTVADLFNSQSISNGESKFRILDKFIGKIDKERKFDAESIIKNASVGGINNEEAEKMIDWQKRYSDDTSNPTIMMDEPDDGMDIINQFRFWYNVVPNLAKDYQLIIITHSACAMKYIKDPSVNIISFFKKKEMEFITEEMSKML
jgi:predicted ATPase